MSFQNNLALLPDISHLSGLDIINPADEQIIHHIPAIEGKLGSLKVYHALAQEFNGELNQQSAAKGLQIFAEHTQDALQNPSKHPNIDLLLQVQKEQLCFKLAPIYR